MRKDHRMPYERVMAMTERQGDCLICTYALDSTGYARVLIGRSARRAHRVVWAMHNGPIPKGLVIRHSCDTPACVEINHLLIGTHADNNRDMMERGRNAQPKGEAHGAAKLTEDDVSAIRADRRSVRTIARDYPVSFGAISHIRTGRNWRHIEKGEHK